MEYSDQFRSSAAVVVKCLLKTYVSTCRAKLIVLNYILLYYHTMNVVVVENSTAIGQFPITCISICIAYAMSSILCLTSRTTVTSAGIPGEGAKRVRLAACIL